MDTPEKPQNITASHRRETFIVEYLKDRNATQAAIRAGYSAKTAGAAASRLLQDVNVRRRLGELTTQDNTTRMKSGEDLKEMLIDAATLDLTDLVLMGRRGVELHEFKAIEPRYRRLITEFTNVSGKTGWRVNFKVFSKEKAAEMLMKVFGIDKGITMNVTGNVSITNLADKYLN